MASDEQVNDVWLCFQATFMVSGKAAKRYPQVIVFFLNLLFFVASIGWMLQFFPDMRTSIVCKRDGTARKSEPQSG